MKALCLFNFDIGDTTCPYWIEVCVIECDDSVSYQSIHSLISNKLVECNQPSLEYGDIVEKTMNSCASIVKGWRWFKQREEIDTYFSFYN